MKGTIDCFLPYNGIEDISETLQQVKGSRMVSHIYLLTPEGTEATNEELTGSAYIPIEVKPCVVSVADARPTTPCSS